MLKKINRNTKGQGLIEYALILTLISILVIVILALMGPAIGNVYSQILDAGSLVNPAAAQSGTGGGGGGGGPPTPGPAPPSPPPGGPPPECYSSLLLPLMLGSAGAVFVASTCLTRLTGRKRRWETA
jgi:pilus assembly protein Flp/PilA